MLKEKLKVVLKYIVTFILGGFVSIAYLLFFSIEGLLQRTGAEVGIGIIALAPVLIIIYGIFYFLVGGLLGLVIFAIFRNLRK